jgi:hypothetical protein
MSKRSIDDSQMRICLCLLFDQAAPLYAVSISFWRLAISFNKSNFLIRCSCPCLKFRQFDLYGRCFRFHLQLSTYLSTFFVDYHIEPTASGSVVLLAEGLVSP